MPKPENKPEQKPNATQQASTDQHSIVHAKDEETTETKPTEERKEVTEGEKAVTRAYDARIATGGQGGGGGSLDITGTEQNNTVTSDELAQSKQPKAPEHPLEVPDAEKK